MTTKIMGSYSRVNVHGLSPAPDSCFKDSPLGFPTFDLPLPPIVDQTAVDLAPFSAEQIWFEPTPPPADLAPADLTAGVNFYWTLNALMILAFLIGYALWAANVVTFPL